MDEDYRCWNCDSRFCFNGGCSVLGNVYVCGHGWTDKDTASAMEATGMYRVNWFEEVGVTH